MENPIKIDDLGVPIFLEIPIYTIAIHGFNGIGNIRFEER